MPRNPFPVALLTVALIATAACRKKEPVTAPEVAAAPAAAPAAPAPPRPAAPTAPSDPLAGDLASVNEYVRQQGLLGTVYFEYDSAELAAAARDRLARNAEFLSAHPQFVVTVEGHADERGTNEYNLALGDRRAGTVREYLGRLGVAGERLRPVSYGEERPECTLAAESCWARNRRAQFTISGRR